MTKKSKNNKEGRYGGYGYVNVIVDGHGFMDIYLSAISSNCTH